MRRLILLFLALCLGKLAFSSSKYEDDYEDDYEDAYDYEGDYDDVDYEYNEIEDDGDKGEGTEGEYGTYYDYDYEESCNTNVCLIGSCGQICHNPVQFNM